KAHSMDSLVQGLFVPLVNALGSLQTGDVAEAIRALEPARRFERTIVPGEAPHWIVYVRGRAYLQSHQPAKAAEEFQRILAFRGRYAESEIIPLARLQLARAFAAQNDAAKARTSYQDFLAAWKDADPDIPILKQAKAEYAKLAAADRP